MRLLTDLFRTKPTQEEVEEMAKKLHQEFCRACFNENESSSTAIWNVLQQRAKMNSKPYEDSYRGWLAAAREALK